MFQPIPKTERVEKGARYRSTYYLTFPYTGFLASTILNAVDTVKPLARLKGMEVISTSTYSPELTAQVPGGRNPRWKLVIEWRAI